MTGVRSRRARERASAAPLSARIMSDGGLPITASKHALGTATPAWRRRVTQLRQPGAEQAVADLETMVEETERPIGRQRGQPERQAGKLDRHRIEVHSVQAALGDGPADAGALGIADV